MTLPCSLEISGLYQNLEVSWTNFTFSLVSGLSSANRRCKILKYKYLPQLHEKDGNIHTCQDKVSNHILCLKLSSIKYNLTNLPQTCTSSTKLLQLLTEQQES